MSEEILKIGMISGIICKDGRHYQELVCVDKNGKDVRIVVPTARVCGNPIESCEFCKEYETCELQDCYENDFGRSLIIKRFE